MGSSRTDPVAVCIARIAAGPRSRAGIEALAALGVPAIEPILAAIEGKTRPAVVYDPRDVDDDLAAALALIARKHPGPLLAALEAGRGGWAVPIALGEAGVAEAVPVLKRRLARSRGFVARWALSKAIADIEKGNRKRSGKRKRRSA